MGVESSVGRFLRLIRPAEGLHVIAYRAMLDVPVELVRYVARLLAAERRARGTRKNSRSLMR